MTSIEPKMITLKFGELGVNVPLFEDEKEKRKVQESLGLAHEALKRLVKIRVDLEEDLKVNGDVR